MTVKECLNQYPINMGWLAESAGVSYDNLRAYKSGRREPRADIRQKILNALHDLGRELEGLQFDDKS